MHRSKILFQKENSHFRTSGSIWLCSWMEEELREASYLCRLSVEGLDLNLPSLLAPKKHCLILVLNIFNML